MSARSWERGHPIYFAGDVWRFLDDDAPVAAAGGIDRLCIKCEKAPTTEGFDACIGCIRGAIAACCGHGVVPPVVIYPESARV